MEHSLDFVKLYFKKDSVICTFEHPFFVNNTWKEAKDLKQGDSHFAYSGYKVALDSIYTFRTDTATAVYNLAADGNHNYYVSATSVLVHNQCSLTDALKPTLERISKGIKFPHKNDGSIFRNTKGLRPEKPLGYYNEFVHPTPGIKHAGLQRVITGKKGEVFYSPDHYESFIKIK